MVAAATQTLRVEDEVGHKRHLARKLTCCVVTIVFLGVCLIVLIQVMGTLTSVPEWEEDVRNAMVALEKENVARLVSDKADFVGEVFGRLQESVVQLREFAGDALLGSPQNMVVDEYLKVHSGLGEGNTTWEHSVW